LFDTNKMCSLKGTEINTGKNVFFRFFFSQLIIMGARDASRRLLFLLLFQPACIHCWMKVSPFFFHFERSIASFKLLLVQRASALLVICPVQLHSRRYSLYHWKFHDIKDFCLLSNPLICHFVFESNSKHSTGLGPFGFRSPIW